MFCGMAEIYREDHKLARMRPLCFMRMLLADRCRLLVCIALEHGVMLLALHGQPSLQTAYTYS